MPDTVSTSCTSPGRSRRRKQSGRCSHNQYNKDRQGSPARSSVSPSTVSELSVDSGVGIEEVRECPKGPDLPEDFDDNNSHIYENFQFFLPQSRYNNSIENLTESLSITCNDPAVPPPPAQFSDITAATLHTGTARDKEHQQEHGEVRDHVEKYRPKQNVDDNVQDDNIYENIEYVPKLSFALTPENHSRIDIQTLRKNKVSRSNFATFCSESLNYHGDVESVHDAMENEYPRNILTMKEETAIMSVKGTVRGVRNRVKTGIKTFLQDQKKKNYIAAENGMCVVFVTSLGIVRETRTRCSSVRKIFRNLCVRISERDVLMSREHYHDLRSRLGVSDLSTSIPLPQVFINGELLGGAELVEQLNESGELRAIVKPLQDWVGVQSVCAKCGGYGMYPCPACQGSKKSGWRSSFDTTIILRCTHCDQGGLVRCDQC